MFVLVVSALLCPTLAAVLDPSLNKWKKLETNYERVYFPLRDYILEVKSFLPEVYDTDPPFGELIKTGKPTNMMMLLYSGDWDNRVGRLVWNTIKYDRGFDIAIGECNARYQAYKSFPAAGDEKQIWAWDFSKDSVELTCNGELQYFQHFDKGERNPRKPGLPEKCRALGDADVDRITFKHMAGEFIRGRPKNKSNKELATTEPVASLVEKPTGHGQDFGKVTTSENFPTCDCWTAECNYCRNQDCAVKLIRPNVEIQVSSQLKWRKYNSIMLYDKEGNAIGNFQWSLRSIFLTGCMRCQTPRALRKIKPGTKSEWEFSMKDNVLRLKVGEKILYEHVLRGSCAKRYGQVASFAFFNATCDNTFRYTRSQMAAGARVTPDCAGTCLREYYIFWK